MKQWVLRLVGALAFACAALAAFASPALADVTIYNFLPDDGSGNNDITEVYIGDPNYNFFYGGGYIKPRDKVSIPKQARKGCDYGYPFTAITRGGDTYTLPAMNVCGANYSVSERGVTFGILNPSVVTPKNTPNDYHISFVNNSSVSIVGIYATSSQDNGWGDQLLSGRIRPGDTALIDLNDFSTQCVYDIEVVARGKVPYVVPRYNVCSEGTLNVTDDDFDQ